MLLRSPTFAEHLTQRAYFGATVGRYANRICDATFVLTTAGGVQSVQLTPNNSGDSLHSGPRGFDSQRWHVEKRSATKFIFSLISVDGDQGFPGHLRAPDGQVQLIVTTTKPALQVYTGNHLAGTLGATGQPYAAHAGVALESEFLPDAPNHPDWPHPSSILLPGQRYSYRTAFRFASSEPSIGA